MKIYKLLPLAVLSALIVFSCNQKEDPIDNPDQDDDIEVPADAIGDTAAISRLWNAKFADSIFTKASDVQWVRWMVDNQPQPTYSSAVRTTIADLRLEFKGKTSTRYVSESDGYAITIPDALHVTPDYTLAKDAMRFESDSVTLKITGETVRPYSPTASGYETYTNEWLTRYIRNSKYIEACGFKTLVNRVVDDSTVLDGYSVTIFSINCIGMDKPYYKVALIRQAGQYARFSLIIYKTKTYAQYKYFDEILKSYKAFSRYGTSKNFLPAQEAKPNPKWNSETLAYYNKLLNSKSFDFGFFSYSMVDDTDGSYDYQRQHIRSEKTRIEAALDQSYTIMPTYTALAWYSRYNGFPCSQAEEFAGGNGFNGKPVLQFTYQFTKNNNNYSDVGTPVFDVIRGKYDKYFIQIAKDIKAYGKPVLFRLNNEMDSDWTSYCGMMSMIDPDIFVQGWRHLYDIFEDNGVDNCIWIFNPNGVSVPYSNWGDFLNYYPGNDYVQAMGETNYEMGNSLPLTSFRSKYTDVYDRYKPYFLSMPWIISEFACGSGGSTSGTEGRYAAEQAQWVRDMFSDFADYDNQPYLQNIKGWVWFSCDDETDAGSTNHLALTDELTETIQAFRDGFAKVYSNK